MSENGFIFKKEKCTQCYGCVVACKIWRNVELGVQWREVKNIWMGCYPDVRSTSLSLSCLHCAEPECVKACPEGAIKKRTDDGLVKVDPEICTGCMICRDACPYSVPQYGKSGKMQMCDLCFERIKPDTESPPCVQSCPTGALMFTQMEKQDKIKEQNTILSLLVSA
jgi:anaerobic dimethyl sulfoxide reductase subunit B